MRDDRKTVSTFQIVGMLFVMLLVLPIFGWIATKSFGMGENLVTPLSVALIVLGFHAVYTISNGPFTPGFHLKQIVIAIAAALVSYVAFEFIDRFF